MAEPARVGAMADRLPTLYRDGELIRGLLAQYAVQIEDLSEEAIGVQRAHWFETTLELSEAARLAALLDIPPEPWQGLGEYRAWVPALRDARLSRGAVTPAAIQTFVADYARGYQAAVGITALPELPRVDWPDEPQPGAVAFVENPRRRRYVRAPLIGGIEPLHQFSVTQRGLDESPVGLLLAGLPTAPECVPVIANLTSGQALIFLGSVPPGARLWLRPLADGTVEGRLEGTDVSDRLRSVSGLVPGVPWNESRVERPARALVLRRGRNALWFLPVAHFDALGFDRFLMALPDLLLAQGRYDESAFDHALFYQDPAVVLRLSWVETEPASFEVHLPGGSLRNLSGELEESLVERDRLTFSLNLGVQKLKAAGVAAAVRLRPFAEEQRQSDALTGVMPIVQRERGPSGADRLPDSGGVFEVTRFEASTFR